MAHKVPIQLDDEGVVVARISGRGDLYGTMRRTSTGFLVLRIDDAEQPEFWAEITLYPHVIAAVVVPPAPDEEPGLVCPNSGGCCLCGADVEVGRHYCPKCDAEIPF